jgi:peptidoglycan/xylan/chitin deacetylase (PgdA/CDA1 family)
MTTRDEIPDEPNPRPTSPKRSQSLAQLLVLGLVVALIGAASFVAVLRGSHQTRRSAGSAVQPRVRATRRPSHIAHRDPMPVPILMYHHVAPQSEGSSLLWVSRTQFAGELAYLRRHAYHTVTLQQVYDCWTKGSPLPSRPVVLSFDDGYTDQYRYAAPLLRRYHDVAVLNLIVHNLGSAPLTIAMVSRMASWGWEIDSHTITHRDLALLPAGEVHRELQGSRNLLRRYLHLPVNFFCYPGGAYDAAVVAAVRRAGYLAATSVRYGLARPGVLFTLPRIVVFGGEPLALYAHSLGGSPRAETAIVRSVDGAGL